MSSPGATPFPTPGVLWLIVGALAGYALMMWTNPVSACFRDGWRAVRRYPRIWLVLSGLGFGNAVFDLAMRAYLHAVLPPQSRPVFAWAREAWRDPQLWLTGSPESMWWLPHGEFVRAMQDSVLPAFENLAGVFNCLVSTFPFSAIAALMLFANWQGHHATLWQAMRKRFGPVGVAVHGAILLCALAALAKPLLYAGARLMPPDFFQQWGPVIAWLSFVFEYFLGVVVQVYLILLVYAWVRGLQFYHSDLLDVAIRRFSFVVKWAAFMLALSTLFIDAPIILKNFAPFASYFPGDEHFLRNLATAQAALALFALLGSSVQITLTFHSESWRKALRHHLRFVAHSWWALTWFLIVAGFHFFAVHVLIKNVARGLGEGTALWVMWRLAAPWFAGAVAAWALASWVCVFKRCEVARALDPESIRF